MHSHMQVKHKFLYAWRDVCAFTLLQESERKTERVGKGEQDRKIDRGLRGKRVKR